MCVMCAKCALCDVFLSLQGNLPMSPMSHQTPKYLAEQNIHFPIIDDWKFERSPSVSDVSISSFLDGFNGEVLGNSAEVKTLLCSYEQSAQA